MILGARRAGRLEAIAEEIRANEGEVDIQPIDVSRREDMALFVDKARDRFGRLDALISNAGLMPLSTRDDLDVDEWGRMIDVNIKGVLYGIAAALPVFREQGRGHLLPSRQKQPIVLGRTVWFIRVPRLRVRAISEGLRREAGDNIRVTIISPGPVESELAETMSYADVKKSGQHDRKRAVRAEAIAFEIAYALGQPNDVDIDEMLIRPTARPAWKGWRDERVSALNVNPRSLRQRQRSRG